MNAREKWIKRMYQEQRSMSMFDCERLYDIHMEEVKRIVMPLVNYAKLKSQEIVVRRKMNKPYMEPEAYGIIIETLKRAGLTAQNN